MRPIIRLVPWRIILEGYYYWEWKYSNKKTTPPKYYSYEEFKNQFWESMLKEAMSKKEFYEEILSLDIIEWNQ